MNITNGSVEETMSINAAADDELNDILSEEDDTDDSVNDDVSFEDVLSEKDFYPPEDRRRYNGLIGNGYDSITDYRKEFFQYIKETM